MRMRMLTVLLFAELNAYSKRRRFRYALCICINCDFSVYALCAHEILNEWKEISTAMVKRWIRVSGLEWGAILAKCKLPRCRRNARHHSFGFFLCVSKNASNFPCFCFVLRSEVKKEYSAQPLQLFPSLKATTSEQTKRWKNECILHSKCKKKII